jgi:PHD/YefM family antitoxin component YafN of YafNO toxin-antitoxin module
MTITASEVKIRGVSIFDEILKKSDELTINVRGKNRYVVLDIDRYKQFRESELDIAHMKAIQDIKEGRYKMQTAKEHIEALMDEL